MVHYVNASEQLVLRKSFYLHRRLPFLCDGHAAAVGAGKRHHQLRIFLKTVEKR